MIPLTKLKPDCFYWATPKAERGAKAEVVLLSTIFGAEPEYWTVACLGSDEHHMPTDFEFIARIVPPSSSFAMELAAE
jgi:hypothetical protein